MSAGDDRGTTLAVVDGAVPDPELLYVACLLHDAGLVRAVAGEDFAVRSADVAAECVSRADAGDTASTAIEDAIAVHATPGIQSAADGALGFYVQAGAVADLGGMRLWDLDPDLVDAAVADSPRNGIKREILELIRAEAQAVPEGRFALLARWGFPLAVRMAPFDD